MFQSVFAILIFQIRQLLWSNPDAYFAVKATVAMGILIVPFAALGAPAIGTTLALGALAAGLAETDDHPAGRIRTLAIALPGFAITSFSVALIRPYPLWFGAGLVGSTILFVLIGGMGERYRGISFGAILIGIYAMLSQSAISIWYQTPLLLCAGALAYGILSLGLLTLMPFRPLEEKLAKGFMALADYLDRKAELYTCDADTEKIKGNQTSIANVQVVTMLERCKEVLVSYHEAVSHPELLKPYLQRFMLLQSLHERAASARQEDESPVFRTEYREILLGFGELMHQLAHSCRLVAENMLTGKPYEHPVSIGWLISALDFELEKLPEIYRSPLALALHNLSRSHWSLRNIHNPDQSTSLPRLRKDERTLWEKFRAVLNPQHARFRYAIRLSACFLAGYLILYFFNLENAEWIILTALFVNQPTYSETRRRLFERILGTFAGILLGIGAMELLPTLPGQMFMLMISAFGFFYFRQLNYAIAVIFITTYVLFSHHMMTGEIASVWWPRILDTVLGAGLALLAIRFLWPDWQYKKLPVLLRTAMQKNAGYFNQILNAYSQTHSPDELGYRVARREAHQADNQLTLSWQSMRLEPKQHQTLMEHAFTMTYLNHVLLSYLSALGALRDTHTDTFPDFEPIAAHILQNMQNAANQFTGQHSTLETNLKPLLHDLRERIDQCGSPHEKQQLRLLYNIAGVSQKLNEQSQRIQLGKSTTDTPA